MRGNRLVWLAVILAVHALINAAVVGYFGLHSHDGFLKFDDETIPITGEMPAWVPDERDVDIIWGDTTYADTVPFTQGMTIMPGQFTVIEVEWIFDLEDDSLEFWIPVDTTK